MTYKDFFEEQTGMQLNEYILKYLDIAFRKYSRKTVSESWSKTIERHIEVKNFENPIEFVKYFNAICRNLDLVEKGSEW